MLVATLGACAVGPTYRPAEPNVPARWGRLATTPTVVATEDKRADLGQWWRRLNDPLLTELVEEAQRQNLDLRKTEARLRQARARRGIAAAGRAPTLGASASAGRTGTLARGGATPGAGSSAAGNQFAAGFDASWEFDLFGGVRRGVEAATADEESATASLDDARLSLIAEVAKNYVEIRSLQIRLGIARDNLARQGETLELTELRARAGLVNTQDVEQARGNREQTAALIPSLETSLAEGEHRLDILLGVIPGTLRARLAAAGSLPEIPAQIAVGIPAETLRRRPDVRAVERTLAAETARLGVAEAARYPSFTLSGSIGLEALSSGGGGTSTGAAYSLLGGLAAPLFNAGRLQAQVDAQDAVREQAQAAYEKAVLIALQDVENALVALDRNRVRGATLERAAKATRAAAQLARQRYSAGVIDFQSVIETERSTLSVEDSLATTRADGVLALIRLYKALGGGWSPASDADLPKRGDS